MLKVRRAPAWLRQRACHEPRSSRPASAHVRRAELRATPQGEMCAGLSTLSGAWAFVLQVRRAAAAQQEHMRAPAPLTRLSSLSFHRPQDRKRHRVVAAASADAGPELQWGCASLARC